MTLADFSARMHLQPVGLDGPVPERMQADWHGWMRDQFTPQMQPGDTIYYYRSWQEDWDRLMGSEGYILVRDGQVIASTVVRMN